ncbi:MAG TPA: DinB family protein [Phnomibacter sp.]|nr:DinB family protein [Phnomibacter sp.]
MINAQLSTPCFKPLLQQLAAYNVWANHRLVFYMQELPQEHWYAHVASSFSSLYKTLLHVWDAESIWWQRMRMHETIVLPSASFEPSFKDACNGLLHQNMEWEAFIKNTLDEPAIASNLLYKNLKGTSFSQPVYEVLLHLFNHGTYHRGQLVTMLRSLGCTNIPQTDFIVFSRVPA